MTCQIRDLATISSDTDTYTDKVVAVGADGDGTVSRFYDAYRHVSNTMGVSLVDETDRDKAFRSPMIFAGGFGLFQKIN